ELEHREVDDPAETKRAFFDEVELFGDAGPRGARQPRRFLLFAGGEEDAIVGPEAHFLGKAVHALLAMLLGDRPAPLPALAGCIAEPGEALAPRPFVHVVEELAAFFRRPGCGNCADNATLVYDSREQAEARTLEMPADVADQQRIA